MAADVATKMTLLVSAFNGVPILPTKEGAKACGVTDKGGSTKGDGAEQRQLGYSADGHWYQNLYLIEITAK